LKRDDLIECVPRPGDDFYLNVGSLKEQPRQGCSDLCVAIGRCDPHEFDPGMGDAGRKCPGIVYVIAYVGVEKELHLGYIQKQGRCSGNQDTAPPFNTTTALVFGKVS